MAWIKRHVQKLSKQIIFIKLKINLVSSAWPNIDVLQKVPNLGYETNMDET